MNIMKRFAIYAAIACLVVVSNPDKVQDLKTSINYYIHEDYIVISKDVQIDKEQSIDDLKISFVYNGTRCFAKGELSPDDKEIKLINIKCTSMQDTSNLYLGVMHEKANTMLLDNDMRYFFKATGNIIEDTQKFYIQFGNSKYIIIKKG